MFAEASQLLSVQRLFLLMLTLFVASIVCGAFVIRPGPKVIKLFLCSTQLNTKFILLINVKIPTIVGILTFISMINTTSERLLYLSVFQFL